MLVDASCRRPLLIAEPCLDSLFQLAGDLGGYADASWAAARRETAARAITCVVQRDQDARAQLMAMGGVHSLLALLDAQVRARHCPPIQDVLRDICTLLFCWMADGLAVCPSACHLLLIAER